MRGCPPPRTPCPPPGRDPDPPWRAKDLGDEGTPLAGLYDRLPHMLFTLCWAGVFAFPWLSEPPMAPFEDRFGLLFWGVAAALVALILTLLLILPTYLALVLLDLTLHLLRALLCGLRQGLLQRRFRNADAGDGCGPDRGGRDGSRRSPQGPGPRPRG